MNSKFKIMSYFMTIFFLAYCAILVYFAINFGEGISSFNAAIFVNVSLLIGLIVVFFEIKHKVIKISFNNNYITIDRYFGLFNSIILKHSEITGFHNSEVSTRYGTYQYIYLMKGNKKIAKISNQYHSNFKELKQEIENKYKDLGFIKSSFISEIKDLIN